MVSIGKISLWIPFFIGGKMEFKISIITGIITFILIFLIDYCFILLPKYNIMSGKKKAKKNKKEVSMMELLYLQKKFKLDLFKVDLDYLIKWFAFLNAFIISLTSTIIMLIPLNMIFQLLIGFVLLIGLIYALYELLGRHLVKKGWGR